VLRNVRDAEDVPGFRDVDAAARELRVGPYKAMAGWI
jgi:hypothetical protein